MGDARAPDREKAPGRSGAAPVRPAVILLAGMHRSGTAAMSGVLSRLGAAIPGGLLPLQRGDVIGFSENRRILALHNALLEEFGSRWDDPLPLSEECFRSLAARAAIRDLTILLFAELSEHPLVLVKDPRLCRLLPLWGEVLSRLGERAVAVLPCRHPFEVAASLEQRNSLSRAHALVLWLQHVLAAEHRTRGMDRCVVVYEELLRDWRSVVGRIGERLGLAWPSDNTRAAQEIEEFLFSEPRRRESAPTAAPEHNALETLSLRAWDALQQLSADESNENARTTFDELVREFAGALRVFAPLVGLLDAQLVQARRELGNVEGQAGATEERCRQLEAGLVRLRRDMASLEAECNVLCRERVAVLSSTFWRLTGPARQLLAAMPPGLTRQARRGARAAYWLLTPHRMPQRVAYLRSRRILLPSVPTHVGEPAATADDTSQMHSQSNQAQQHAKADKIIVSVHIYKTGGLSFCNALEEYFGDRLLLDYDMAARSPPCDFDALIRNYEAIHGHFIASKYLPIGPRARFATFFREPVARTISHYNFWRRKGPDEKAQRIRSGELSLERFAEMPEIRSFYARFLGGVEIEQFAFIGLTEAYETSLALFNAVFGVELAHMHDNVAPGDPEDGALSKKVLDAVKVTQEGNTELYNRARRRFADLCAAYL